MTTEPIEAADLLAAGEGAAWAGMPDGSIIGHMHLQVADTAEAERFYRDRLGFDVTCRYPGASFFGSGGYHHRLAANVWNSAGTGPRSPDTNGLARVELVLDATAAEVLPGAALPGQDGKVALDPCGTAFVLR
jgi:catechol 2,3-dioxygenase